jgi:hypothetical protein
MRGPPWFGYLKPARLAPGVAFNLNADGGWPTPYRTSFMAVDISHRRA